MESNGTNSRKLYGLCSLVSTYRGEKHSFDPHTLNFRPWPRLQSLISHHHICHLRLPRARSLRSYSVPTSSETCIRQSGALNPSFSHARQTQLTRLNLPSHS